MSDNVNHPSHYTDGQIEVIICGVKPTGLPVGMSMTI